MGAFWNSWQLWEKLCFVLGASIVLVILGGIGKLAHTHWKLRKYTALAKTKAAQKEEALQRNPSAGRRKNGNDIPFGIRAIESGIEVDGVWISRSNTPANSTPVSPTLSASKEPAIQAAPMSDRASTASNMSRLEIPQPAHGHQGPNARSSNPSYSRVSGNPFDRSPTRPGSSYLEATPRGRPSYQPRRSSHLRFSNSHTVDSAEALATLEGRELRSKTGSKTSQDSAEYELSEQRGSDDSWSGSSGETHRQYVSQSHGTARPSNGQRQSVPVKPLTTRYRSSDLDSLASHRKSHAAETGQLLPRVRVNDGTGEWTGVQQPAGNRDFTFDRSVSSLGSSADPFATPHGTPLMTPSQEPSRGPPSFEEFVRSTSPQGQYYLGDEAIPLQHQPKQRQLGDDQGSHSFSSESITQSGKLDRREQDTPGRKASSFSEAV
ncbi:MAG: hypothetical protein Q9219_000488 [cf. Caloplaca sp. 3 TL-2023]